MSTGKGASKFGKVKVLAKKTRVKTKELLSLNQPHGEDEKADERAIQNGKDDLSTDPAFDPSKILEGSPPQLKREASEGLTSTLESAASAIIHPVRAMRKKATKSTAGKIGSTQRSFLSAEQDQKLLDAHEDLATAKSAASSTDLADGTSEDTETEQARDHVESLENNRASLRTAWVIGRHVQRVKVVRRPEVKPRRKDFIQQDSSEQKGRFQWERWLASLILYYTRGTNAHYIDDFEEPPFDMQDLIRIVERLAVVSGSWQTFFIDLRKVYMWQNPKRTGKWLALFVVLWYTDHIVGFVYGYIIYATIRNRYYPSSVETVRESITRSFDRGVKAQAWGELLEKHGRDDWIEPLLDDIGPVIQMQLGDLTNFLEVLTNFYRWEVPNKTAASLFFFAVCLSITLLTDMRFCMRVVWFIIGGGFFATWPLATRYPKYRIVVDVVRWVFWDIPTHAELGIMQLQQKTIMNDFDSIQNRQISGKPRYYSSSGSDSDFVTPATSPERISTTRRKQNLSCHAYLSRCSGRLIITRSGIIYRQKSNKRFVSFSQLVEMRKVDVESKRDRLASFQLSAEGLEFVFRTPSSTENEELLLIVHRRDRHLIFSHVLGWSAVKWQALQMERHKEKGDSRTPFDRSLKRALPP